MHHVVRFHGQYLQGVVCRQNDLDDEKISSERKSSQENMSLACLSSLHVCHPRGEASVAQTQGRIRDVAQSAHK